MHKLTTGSQLFSPSLGNRCRDFTVSAHVTRSQSRVQTKEIMDEGKYHTQQFKSILRSEQNCPCHLFSTFNEQVFGSRLKVFGIVRKSSKLIRQAPGVVGQLSDLRILSTRSAGAQEVRNQMNDVTYLP